MNNISLKVPEPLATRLEDTARQKGVSKSALIRDALEAYLQADRTERAESALALVIRVYRQPRPEHMPPEYRADIWPLWFVAFAFLHNRKFGGLFLLGLGLEAGLRQLAWLD